MKNANLQIDLEVGQAVTAHNKVTLLTMYWETMLSLSGIMLHSIGLEGDNISTLIECVDLMTAKVMPVCEELCNALNYFEQHTNKVQSNELVNIFTQQMPHSFVGFVVKMEGTCFTCTNPTELLRNFFLEHATPDFVCVEVKSTVNIPTQVSNVSRKCLAIITIMQKLLPVFANRVGNHSQFQLISISLRDSDKHYAHLCEACCRTI